MIAKIFKANMKTDCISVDIVIPQYKNITLLTKLLESLSNIIFPNEIQNVWIIENGGKFGAKKIVEAYEHRIPVKYDYLLEGNLSLARNKGIQLSCADILIFFDNDMTFYENTLTSYIEQFKKHRDLYFYGGALEPDYQEAPVEWLTPFLPNSAKGFSLGTELTEHIKPDFLGGNHAVYRKHLIAVGGYDLDCASGNNSGLMGEETRLQQKLLDKNITGLFIPHACVKHFVPRHNCSKKWLLQRASRYGETLGSHYADNNNKKLLNVPIYHFRKVVSFGIDIIFNLLNEQRLFLSRYRLAVQIGIIKQILKNN